MKYQIGDKLVCPLHGAGIITSIEECQVLGKLREYYVLSFEHLRMKLNIPTDGLEGLNIRELISEDELPAVKAHFYSVSEEVSGFWNKRHKEMMDKLRSGDIYSCIEVYTSLRIKEIRKFLSPIEKKLLVQSGNCVISELMYVIGKSYSEVNAMVDDIIFEISKGRT